MSTTSLPYSRSRGVLEVGHLVDLAEILDPAVHIAFWSRPACEQIQGLLQRPDWQPEPFARTVLPRDAGSWRQAITRLLPGDEGRFAKDPGAAALVEDVRYLCEAFAELVCADEMMVSLEGPDEASCPRFHVDQVGIRMLVTYSGPGTEFLLDEHTDRSRLGHAGAGKPDHENGVMRPGAEVQRVPTYAVVLLKGENWPGASGFGAVHRSPDPEGVPRTLVRVDMLSQREFEGEER